MNTVTTSRSTANGIAVGFASGALIAVPALLAAVASGGAGHDHYVAARALFPVPMLLTLPEAGVIGALSITAALLQFPIYGATLGWAVARRNYLPAVALMLAHIGSALACFAGALPNFN